MSFYFKYTFLFISFFFLPLITPFPLSLSHHNQPFHPLSLNTSDYLSLLNATFHFLELYSNIQTFSSTCYTTLSNHITNTNNSDFIFNIFSFSGKGVSELGLEYECDSSVLFNMSYFLILYNYNSSAFSSFSDGQNVFSFLYHSSFYTGICLIKECSSFINDLLNRTINPKLFNYLQTNHSINDITFLSKDKDVSHITSYERTLSSILLYLILSLLFVQIVFTFVHIFIYIPYKVSKKQKMASGTDNIEEGIEIDLNEDEEFTESFLRRKRKNTNEMKYYSIFTKSTTTLDELNDISDGNICKKKCLSLVENILELFNVFSNLKLLTSKKNFYYNEEDIEIISFFRVIVIVFMTMLQNMETIIKIPARDFLNEEFYTSFLFGFLKLASFSIECYVALDGFLMMYKLMFYIKAHTSNKVGNKISFGLFLSFYIRIISKMVAFIFVFFYFSICTEYVLLYFNNDSLYKYFITQIYDKDVHKWLLQIIFPFYNFIISYSTSTNYNKLFSYNRFITMYINQFYVFTFVLILIYFSFKLKSKVFDIVITILFIINISFMWLTCPSETYSSQNDYDINKVIRSLFTIRYPHIMLNHFIIGVFSGLICFYHKDVISNSPMIEQDEQYCPFKWCYNVTQFIDSLQSLCKSILFYIDCVILIVIAVNFKILILLNGGNLLMKYSIGYEMLHYYEKTCFLICFIFMVILLQTDNEESSIKQLMSARVFTTVARIDLCYVSCLSAAVYGAFCLFHFQLKLSYQNLWFLSFGLFVFCFVISLVITIIIEVPLRILIKEIINIFTKTDEEEEDIIEPRRSLSHKKKIK